MLTTLKSMLRDDAGQTMAEYGLSSRSSRSSSS